MLVGGPLGIAALTRLAESESSPNAVDSADPYAIPTDGQWRAFAEAHIKRAMDARKQAIRDGNLEQYLDVIDPDAPELRRSMERVFTNIQQLGIGWWHESHIDVYEVPTGPIDLETFIWRSGAQLRFCFGTSSCPPETAESWLMWRFRDGRMVLTDVEPVPTGYDPRPWDVADLVVARGERTVLAASTTSGFSPEEYLDRAEAAAAIADSFAHWDPPPTRYIVFLADSAEFDTWVGVGAERLAVGVYLTAGQISIDVPGTGPSGMQDIFVHEMTHATTMPPYGNTLSFVKLPEGMAEYATMVGRPVSQYRGLNAVAQSLDTDPATLDPRVHKNAQYGVAFLTLRYLADTFGEDAMLRFYYRVVYQGELEPVAANLVFNRDWTSLEAEIDAHIRRVV